MKLTSVLDTVWYNTHDSSTSFSEMIVLLVAGETGPSDNGSGTRILTLTDDVESPLDAIRRARPIAAFECITAF